jgi:hypothetical protein
MKKYKGLSKMWFLVLFLLTFVAGCSGSGSSAGSAGSGSGSSEIIAPTVNSTAPATAATGVPINNNLTVTFSGAMDPASINATTFTVQASGPPLGPIVVGIVNYDAITNTATFTPPASNLVNNIKYTATITTGAKNSAGIALASDFVWSFTTANPIANPTAPTLGETARFVILASQAVTTTGTTAIRNGDIGIIDLARTFFAGFTTGVGPGQFTELTNGLSYAHDDMPPFLIPAPYASTIAFINQVRTDLGIANTFLAADPNPSAPTQDCPIELGTLVLNRGVYKTSANVGITTGPLHLDAQGDPNAVFIFSIGGTLATGASGSIVLDNGAQAKNIYFRTAGITTIAAGTTFYGNVFAATQVNVLAGANVTGRLFAVTDRVTLIADAVTKAP